MTAEETRAVLSAIKTRRSFRKYKSTPVPQELIDKLLRLVLMPHQARDINLGR